MALHIRAASASCERELRGERDPLGMREMYIVDFVRALASGDVNMHKARDQAAKQLEAWLEAI